MAYIDQAFDTRLTLKNCLTCVSISPTAAESVGSPENRDSLLSVTTLSLTSVVSFMIMAKAFTFSAN